MPINAVVAPTDGNSVRLENLRPNSDMSHDPAENGVPCRGGAKAFEDQVTELCLKLESWRKAERKLEDSDPDEIPGPNWRVAGQALTFFALGSAVVLVQSSLKFVQGFFSFALYMLLLAICGGASLVLELRALHIFERRYWKAVVAPFRTKDNYPFTPLLRRTERDFLGLTEIQRYSDAVVKAVEERLGLLDTELRERLGLLGGNSAFPAIVGFATTIWSALKSLQTEKSMVTIAALIGSILVLLLTGYAFRLRFSLFELTRCRTLLALELARRKSSL